MATTERLKAYTKLLELFNLKKQAKRLNNQLKGVEYRKGQAYILSRGALKTQFFALEILQKYLTKIPPKHILIIFYLSFYEYFFLSTEKFAVVNEWVEITPRPFKKLVNAILRNWTRDYQDRKIDIDYKKLLPKNIQDYLMMAIPNYNEFLRHFLDTPNIFFISSTDKNIGSQVRIDGELYQYTNDTGIFDKLDRDIYIQDLAPQYIINRALKFIKNRKTVSVVDMCSAPGGKSISVAFRINKTKQLKLCLSDEKEDRIQLINENLSRLNIRAYKIKKIDATKKNYAKLMKEECHQHSGFDLVILDAPCSSLGTMARHPEVLIRFDKRKLIDYQTRQIRLLESAVKLSRKGSYVLYTVCTLTPEETTLPVQSISSKYKLSVEEEQYVYLYSDKYRSDIHYYAIFRKE